ncbi:MAG TPA: DNA repair protein RadA [Bdellovibrionota bacterium]|nr:DNA repair protein RadA [Bdellovibrionota bacterium]
MAKTRTIYVCQNCGSNSPKWVGKCPDCDQWNRMVEEVQEGGIETTQQQAGRQFQETISSPIPITEVSMENGSRLPTGIEEFDRVLGGGIVPGSVVLVGGDPGIGKSTLLLQALNYLAEQGEVVLYVSAEESLQQIKLRGIRLGTNSKKLFVVAETSLENILKQIRDFHPTVVVIDSIQTTFTSILQSAPGSVSQVREVAAKLMYLSKGSNLSTFFIGHVTKDGSLAGPKVLEHMVDTVLYFEGDTGSPYRILRAVKNRYGSTNEIGVFEMKAVGLQEVRNPSELFLAERPEHEPGSVVIASIEGTRPILVEIQALVSHSPLGVPRRTTIGVDHNRVSLLVAVLEKKVGLQLSTQDVFVNVAGGVKLNEPATDLGLIAALASSFQNRPIDSKTIVFGEVGLAGEVRTVSHTELRVKEAAKLGFTRCLLPEKNAARLKGDAPLELIGVSSVIDALEVIY